MNSKNYWFKAKTYGWGWVPARWQGWLVLAVWAVLMLGNYYLMGGANMPDDDVVAYICRTIILAIALMVVCWLTGEKPRWRWGEKD